MDDPDPDYSDFKTPQITPHNSHRNRTEEYSDVEISTSEIENHHVIVLQRTVAQTRLVSSSSSINQEYESETESDSQEKRATEATDDSNDSKPLHKDPVEKTIDNSLRFQNSPQSNFYLQSYVQETTASEENFSDIISDVKHSYNTGFSETDVCSQSFCEPYMVSDGEKDEISLLKTTFTTIEVDDTEPKKKFIGHIMISYNHSTRPLCTRIAKELKNLNYLVWIDQDNISGDILTSMASAVENAYIVLMAVNEHYYRSRYCRLGKFRIITKPDGWLGIINGSKFQIDFVQFPFDEAFGLLVREIEAVRQSVGIDETDRSVGTELLPTQNGHAVTTVDSCWSQYRNVSEWNDFDVIEWLNREKLEIFQESLTHFKGATLWQFYKIKFDSPTDYYRYVESLLPLTTPNRLFHILTFNGALESLFASHSSITQRR